MFGFFNAKAVGEVTLYNTRGRKKEIFVPQKGGEVKMYSCGPTVYNYVHIGNLRSYVFADILKRALKAHGYKVKHVINLTDFGHLTDDADQGEDKMTVALKRLGKPFKRESMKEVAAVYTASFQEDMDALGNLPPTLYTPASDYIVKEIALVKTLVEKGYTYETSDGIYFDIEKFPEYGKLGHIDVHALKEGARVTINAEKRHPADFAVWKKSPLGWKSPWGHGFPGWHIECTAMIFATLGKQIDIHTGGIDHIHTHHNGEIAQAEAATKKVPFVKYWMHNAFITIDATKVSKSLGNGIRLAQLKDRGYSALSYRYWLLTGHYRSPMNFTFEALDGAKQAWFRLRRHMYEEWKAAKGGTVSEKYWNEFFAAISDDLDTPKALAIVWNVVNDKTLSVKDKVATIKKMDGILNVGLLEPLQSAMVSLGVVEVASLPSDVRALIEEREAARAAKEWERADAARRQLNLAGYMVEDTPTGPRVTKV
jgi:cysteinyl-tRNA synthetase